MDLSFEVFEALLGASGQPCGMGFVGLGERAFDGLVEVLGSDEGGGGVMEREEGT